MRNKLSKLFMGMGVVLVCAALALFLWNQYDNKRAGDAAEDILDQVKAQIEVEASGQDNPSGEGTGYGSSEDPVQYNPYNPEMREVTIGDYNYVGYLSMPTLGMEFPVMADWSYDKLRIAPCRYYGSSKMDDLVIAAHNYREHFGSIQNLSIGDRVYFMDMDQIVTEYEVAEVDLLGAEAVEEMTAGEYALTLFTCNYSGQSRVTVRCSKITYQ